MKTSYDTDYSTLTNLPSTQWNLWVNLGNIFQEVFRKVDVSTGRMKRVSEVQCFLDVSKNYSLFHMFRKRVCWIIWISRLPEKIQLNKLTRGRLSRKYSIDSGTVAITPLPRKCILCDLENYQANSHTVEKLTSCI